MALGLYKPGQGYWVRVLTAAMGGVLVLAACAWLWGQVQLVPIPTPTWRMQVSGGGAAAVQVGETVALLADVDEATPGLEQIGTGRLLEVAPGSGRVQIRVGELRMNAGATPGQATAASKPEGATIGTVAGLAGVPVIDRLYLQAAVVAAALLAGAAVIYWVVGVRPSTAEFLIATDGEMKKVNWSTRKGVIDSTWVVILWSVVLAGGLFIIDGLFAQAFKLIGVLE